VQQAQESSAALHTLARPRGFIYRFNRTEHFFRGHQLHARNADWFDPNMRMAYVIMWSAGVRVNFAHNWVAELNTGNAGHRASGKLERQPEASEHFD